MPWQQHVADVAYEVLDNGSFAYSEIGLTVPRQSGKTTLLLPVLSHRCIAEFPGGLLDIGPQRQAVTYTAQTRNDARKKWIKEFLPILQSSPLAERFDVRLTNGSEGMDWQNGSTLDLMATMEKSGHGDVSDLALLDEIFAHTDDRLDQATIPAQNTRLMPQRWKTSTAGESAIKSPFLWDLVERGRDAVGNERSEGLAYFEWSFAEDEDPFAEATWHARHPALGITLRVETIRAAALSMKPAEFKRAFGNMWGTSKSEGHIPADDWDLCTEETAAPSGRLGFGVDISPSRDRASIVVVGEWIDWSQPNPETGNAGLVRPCGELVECRPGTDWVVPRLIELCRWPGTIGVALDGTSPASSLHDPLEAAGVKVYRASTRDAINAAAGLFDDVKSGLLAHRGQDELTAAIGGAAKRDVGDSWLFGRRTSGVDITPTVALSLALWLHTQHEADAEQELEPSIW